MRRYRSTSCADAVRITSARPAVTATGNTRCSPAATVPLADSLGTPAPAVNRTRTVTFAALAACAPTPPAGHRAGRGPERPPPEVGVRQLARPPPLAAGDLPRRVELEHVLVPIAARVRVDAIAQVPR